jgi:hypothetical protein
MLMTKKSPRPLTPVRARSPHSMMTAASKSPDTWSAMMMSGTPGKVISGGGAASLLTITTSLPRARTA